MPSGQPCERIDRHARVKCQLPWHAMAVFYHAADVSSVLPRSSPLPLPDLAMLPSSEPPPTWVIKAHDAAHAQRAKAPGTVTLSVASWNLQLLWPQAGALPFRAACIADRLLVLGADIVCLQVRREEERQGLSLSQVTSLPCL